MPISRRSFLAECGSGLKVHTLKNTWFPVQHVARKTQAYTNVHYRHAHAAVIHQEGATLFLQAQMEEKQRQIDVLKGRRVKRRPILPILANGLAVCEKRATEEVTLTSGHLAATPSALSCIHLTCRRPLPLSINKNSDPQHLS